MQNLFSATIADFSAKIKYFFNPSAKNSRQKNHASTPDFLIDKRQALLLLLSQILNLVPLISQLTFWMITVACVGILIRLLAIQAYIKSPSSLIVNLVALMGCAAIAVSSKQLGLLLAMLHLLALAYVLKAVELKSRKDFYQLFLLGMFILTTSLLFEQSLLFTLAVTVIILVNFTSLLHYFSYSTALKTLFATSGKLMILSLPLTVLLFIVFPRLPPFWQMPQSKSATTGLSENVRPGDIANLALSNELAFRVTFDDKVPQYSDLYWRALVLDSFDDKGWQRSEQSKKLARQYLQGQKKANLLSINEANKNQVINYQVISQPSYQTWLFALDIAEVIDASEGVVALPDFTLQSRKPMTKAISYQVNSHMQVPLDLILPDQVKQQNLLIPQASNPKLLAEAERLRSLYNNDLELVHSVLNNFREQNYFYTLQPPLLDNNSLDQFYFDTKQGFCAHYASAFTFLMRAAGIPARMVTGYLGGEFNPNANYYSIYQSDAHAWSEIWLPNKGWVRIDPTSAVDPERIERGFSSNLLLEQSNINDSFFNLSSYKNYPIIGALRLQFAAIDYQWTRLVVGYSSTKQLALLSKWFGKMKAWKTALIIGLGVIGTMLLLMLINYLRLFQRSKNSLAEYEIIYQEALFLLTKGGFEKPQSMSALVYSNRLLAENLPWAKVFNQLSQCFIKLHYQTLSAEDKEAVLIKMREYALTFKKRVKKSIKDKM